MAEDSPSDHLSPESIRTVDLRLLSQAELYALSLCSDASFDPRRCDDVVIPKIDRSVFNESAGSRKQTYSRLRLAPRKPETAFASATTTAVRRRTPHLRTPDFADNNDPERVENSRIVGLLKELFVSETDGHELIPVRVEYSQSLPELSNVGHLPKKEPSNVGHISGTKRKRGRPRKNETAAAVMAVELEAAGGNDVMRDIVVHHNVEDRDKEIVNKNGVALDLRALANLEDPYAPELKRRTEGMDNEEALLGFLGGLNGQWGSRRRKKRIVDASGFGDTLPKGWKLSLCVKKKEGRVWLNCRRYISPNGRQFASCKEVSSYLLSFSRVQDANLPNCGHNDENIQAANLAVKEDNKRGDLVCHSPSPTTCIFSDHEKQVTSNIGNPGQVQGETLNCHKCTMTFDVQDDLLHHQFSCHRRKRSKFHATVSDGVIIKDGKYECQFCHKTFIEWKRYNGHVGAHVKNHVKSVDAAAGVLNMQNTMDPVPLGGAPPRESMVQASIGDDSDLVAKTINAKADDELNSVSLHNKADFDVETHSNKFDHELDFLSNNKDDMRVNKNEKTSAEESFVEQDRDCRMTDEYPGSIEEATAVAENFNFCLGSEAAMSNNENNGDCGTSGPTNVLDRTANRCFVGQERILESFSPFANKKTCGVEINVNEVSANAKNPNQDVGSESGLFTPYENEKMCGIENLNDTSNFNNTIEELKLDRESSVNNEPSGFHGGCAGQDEDILTKVKKQSRADVCLLVPVSDGQKHSNANNINGVSTCIVTKSGLMGPESSVLVPSCYKETCCGKDDVQMIGFSGSGAGRHEDVGIGVEQERSSESCSLIPHWKEKCVIEDKSTCMMEEPWLEKDCKSSLLNISGYEQTCGVEEFADKVSRREMEPKFEGLQSFRNGELVFGSSHSIPNEDVLTSTKQGSTLEFCSLVSSGNQQSFSVTDKVTRVNNGTVEEPKQEGVSESDLLARSCIGQSCNDVYILSNVSTSSMEEPKLEVQNSRNTNPFLGFENTHIGLNADAMTNIGIEQTGSVETNVSRVSASRLVESQEERGFGNLFLGLSCNSTFGSGNNLNKVYPDRVWEEPRIEEVDCSGNEKLMIGFGSRNKQLDEDVMASDIWRTDEENALRSGFVDNSTDLVQSSSSFPTFNIIPNKGENELSRFNEKYDSMSGLEGMRSGSIEHVEFDFLHSQNLNSHPENSKVLAYNTEIGQGFGSSFWLEKDALSPNVAARNQITSICVWCRNVFHHEPVHTGTQTGAIGSLCPTCNAKISEQFNVL
ncbi:uncharacterized protein LOC132276311 [Cornus florida]|uniref:uncharacterized protein LOC132276311 n=1 Tax=Cornus florida TaxID=4283 RepID=UPI0028A2187B|nr:uncharacterized protein LOC132276311 [Cornus florida]